MLKKLTKKTQLGYGLLATGLATIGGVANTVVCSHAAYHYKFFTNAAKNVSNLKGDIITFGSVIAGLMLAVAFGTIMLSKDPKKVSAGWSWVKGIGIAYVGLMSITAILSFFKDFQV